MYHKERESDKEVARQYNENQKKNAAERLARNAAWNKKNKSKEDKE